MRTTVAATAGAMHQRHFVICRIGVVDRSHGHRLQPIPVGAGERQHRGADHHVRTRSSGHGNDGVAQWDYIQSDEVLATQGVLFAHGHRVWRNRDGGGVVADNTSILIMATIVHPTVNAINQPLFGSSALHVVQMDRTATLAESCGTQRLQSSEIARLTAGDGSVL